MKSLRPISLYCVLAFSSMVAVGSAQQATSFRFTLTGDPRSELAKWRHTLKQMKTSVEGEFAFHITAGDYFEEDRSTVAKDFYEVLKDEFGEDVKWYPGMGNHELKEGGTDVEWLRQFYRDQLSGKVNPGPKGCEETTYSWDYGNAHFVQLDIYCDGGKRDEEGEFGDALYNWLVEDLNQNTQPLVFVIYHEPAFPNDRGGKDSPDGWKRFMKLLNDRKVVAGLCAHSHTYARYKIGGDWEPFTWEVDAGNAGRMSHADKHQTFVDIVVHSSGLVEFNTWQGVEGDAFRKTDSWTALAGAQADASHPGLAGNYFNSEDFQRPEPAMDVLLSLDNDWGRDRGTDWSARWTGFIEGPFGGEVTFIAEVNDGLALKIGETTVIDALDRKAPRTGAITMTKGKKAPVVLEFVSLRGDAKLRLYWQWEGQAKTMVPGAALSHDADQIPANAKLFDYEERLSKRDDDDDDDDNETDYSESLPRFTGGQPPYADTDYHDGRFRPAVGVHNFEVIRSNRTYPNLVTDDIPSYPDANIENVGFTYNHAPMLSHWQDRFWLLYRSGPVHEHQEPCYALITWSRDGRSWHKPQTIFPARKFRNRKKDDKAQYSISHQRMGWYVAPDGRLIACAYYGMPGTPNDGKGVGRVVREVKGPGVYGPIYWVRYNRYQRYTKDDSPHFPYYSEAPDEGFVKAIDSLLGNRLVVQQWYEEDRDNTNDFFALAKDRVRHAKAFAWYELPDGRTVGMWKWKKLAVAEKWEPGHVTIQGEGKDIYYGGAKIWGQRTSDGKYALVYNPVRNTTWRHPLSVVTGNDGLSFDQYFLNVHGETPLMRFGGANKDGGGAQYVRGIIPGNGTPPDGAMWLTYSSNKEDIFVTRVPVPIKGTVDKDVKDDFEDMKPGGVVDDWNIYSGIWTPISVVKDKGDKVLRLQDKAPYDYAKAVRVFPEATTAQISFGLQPHQAGHGDLEIEVLNYKGQRPVRIKVEGKSGKIKSNNGESFGDVASFSAGKWLNFDIFVDTTAGEYDLQLNGKDVVSGASFAETLTNTDNPYKSKHGTPTVERIEFRTGPYRLRDFSRYGFSDNDYLKNEPDLPDPDEAVKKAVFDIDDFHTATGKSGKRTKL